MPLETECPALYGKRGMICPGVTSLLLKLTRKLMVAGFSSSLAVAGDCCSLPHGCLPKLPERPHDMAAGFPHSELSEEDSKSGRVPLPAQDESQFFLIT